MKTGATLSRKHSLDLDPTDHISAGAVDSSAATPADSDQDLATLVWRYFQQEITEALVEVQEALAPERERLKPEDKSSK